MRILAITYAFAPLRYPATFRLLKWFHGLGEMGHEITVLAVDPRTFPGNQDATLSKLVPPRVRVVSAPSREATFLYRVLRLREEWFPGLFEPRKKEWYGPARKALRDLDPASFDVVFSCSQPPVCHLLGLEIRRRWNRPWVAFFSDPWVDNPFRPLPPRQEKVNLRWEREVVGEADALLFPSSELAEMMLAKYPAEGRRKPEIVPHCFVKEWYSLAPPPTPPGGGGVRFLSTGNFYGPRSPAPILDALDRIQARGSRPFSIDFYGAMAPQHKETLARSRLESLRFHGGIEYLPSLGLMTQADFLLLIDAATQEEGGGVFFPSKLADYLGSGSPILGITPRNSVSARVLAETGHVVCPFEDSQGLESTLASALDGTLQVTPDPGAVERYDHRAVVPRLAGILDRVGGRRGGIRGDGG
jgi:hypothetical protein